MSSRRLRFTPEAEQDIRGILQYTLRVWGDLQHDAYAERLDTATQNLLRFAELGRERDDIAVGLRSHPVDQHIIYYRVDDQDIAIVRVLHRRMNPSQQLAE